MARTIQNTVRIDAPTATVWAILTNFDERSEWDSYYREVRGEPARGARLTVRASLNDESGRRRRIAPRPLPDERTATTVVDRRVNHANREVIS